MAKSKSKYLPSGSVQAGTVKWFSDEKGFGFIARAGKPDLFVHHTSINMEGRRRLVEGQEVEFYEEESQKTGKPNAVQVRVVE